MSEIAEAFALGKSTVYEHLRALGRKRYIQLSPDSRRAIKILRDLEGNPVELQPVYLRAEPDLQLQRQPKPSLLNRRKIHFLRIEIEALNLLCRYIEERCDTPDIPVPVPVAEIAGTLGLQVKRSALDQGVVGRLLWKEREILVNSAQSRRRQRFTIAHEIGHYALHSSVETSFCQVRAMGQEEREANYFAARLLMPADLLRDEVRRLLPIQNPGETVNQLADQFDVSNGAMKICLQELGFLSERNNSLTVSLHV